MRFKLGKGQIPQQGNLLEKSPFRFVKRSDFTVHNIVLMTFGDSKRCHWNFTLHWGEKLAIPSLPYRVVSVEGTEFKDLRQGLPFPGIGTWYRSSASGCCDRIVAVVSQSRVL